MVTVIFRSRLKPTADLTALGTLYARLLEIVSRMPGFISVKDFAAEDGESVAIAEFESPEAVTAWKNDPEHLAAQKRGREEFFSEYTVQVCTVVRAAKL
jgi:heme-degrading monooxygenase HmoA